MRQRLAPLAEGQHVILTRESETGAAFDLLRKIDSHSILIVPVVVGGTCGDVLASIPVYGNVIGLRSKSTY